MDPQRYGVLLMHRVECVLADGCTALSTMGYGMTRLLN